MAPCVTVEEGIVEIELMISCRLLRMLSRAVFAGLVGMQCLHST